VKETGSEAGKRTKLLSLIRQFHMKVQPPPEEEIDARYRANTMGSDVSDELQNTTGPSPVSQQVSEVVGEGVDWEMINIGQEDMKLFERMMEEKIEGLRSEIYSEVRGDGA